MPAPTSAITESSIPRGKSLPDSIPPGRGIFIPKMPDSKVGGARIAMIIVNTRIIS
ncbi:unnamed protein product [marine sediment metagenome]|uniref:Uncharacterized protein n=1 Tax=marine sediment metagenome TaxID=412755 RepID=X1QGW4_9ZZZZ